MKRRSFQVTRLSKDVDVRLKRIEDRIIRIEKLVDFIEMNLFKTKTQNKKSSANITYTINTG